MNIPATALIGGNHSPETPVITRSIRVRPGPVLVWMLIAVCLARPGFAQGQVPLIVAGPMNQVVAAGGMVTLGVTATGGAPMFYQWFKDGRRLLDATNNTLVFSNAAMLSSGSYDVVVTNQNGMAISFPALVSVGNPALLGWGYNGYGQFGNGTIYTTNLPEVLFWNMAAASLGGEHSMFLTTNGTLLTAGFNAYGQLGNGTTVESELPFTVASNVLAAAGGANFSLYLMTNGTLWAMGGDYEGQLDDKVGSTTVPVDVASNVVAVAAGEQHSLFLTADGKLWTVGYNAYGQLGEPLSVFVNPVAVNIASNVVQIAAGMNHSLYVTMDGTLWAMGYGGNGQIGNGTATYSNPVPLSVATNVVAVAAGGNHSLFITTDGELWAMGNGGVGQLGNGSNVVINPLPVNVASNVVEVAAAEYHSLFVTTNGALWTMGEGNYGQLGTGSYNGSLFPVQVPNVSVASLFAGDNAIHSLVLGYDYHASVALAGLNQPYTGNAVNVSASTVPPGLTVNLTYNGSAVAPTNVGTYTVAATISDANYFGGTTNTLVISWLTSGAANQSLPAGGTVMLEVTTTSIAPPPTYCQWFKNNQLIPGATNVLFTVTNAGMADSGIYYAVLTNTLGLVISPLSSVVVGCPCLLAWGNNAYGQLGNGNTNNTYLPSNLASNVVQGAAGGEHSLFVTSDGTLWAMGANTYGQLGDGTVNNRYLPVSVASNVVAVAAGTNHSLFVTADGTLWGMGLNALGEIGLGYTNGINFNPVRVAGNVVAVAAGQDHSIFLKADGTLWAMGANGYGQSGNGDRFIPILPAPVCAASNVVVIAAGGNHSYFVETDGILRAVGQDGYGELGNGTRALFETTPVNVASNVIAIAGGEFHTLFVTKDRAFWSLGDGQDGELGYRAVNGLSLGPVAVASNVVAITAGPENSLFVTAGGNLWAAGNNVDGQLGIQETNDVFTPVLVPQVFVASLFPGNSASHSLASGYYYPPNTVNLAGAAPVISFGGMPGSACNVERSMDLVNWSVIWTTNIPADGVFQITDSTAPQTSAYYRIQPLP